MMPVRVQLRRTKGWRMPQNTVSVARPALWGNPFYVSRFRDAATCVALFAESVRGGWNPSISAHLPDAHCGYSEHCHWHAQWRSKMNCSPWDWLSELRGKNLACWCALNAPCHADILLELANPASVDTDPEGRDAKQARFIGSAVASAQADDRRPTSIAIAQAGQGVNHGE